VYMMDVAVEIRKGGKALREVTCGGVQQYLWRELRR
jgi:hypothetical protein